MILHGTQFNCEISDVISELRMQLAENGVERFAKTFPSGDNLMVQCPYHGGGHERKPSAGIRMSDGFLNCLACNKKASLDEVIANCFGYSDPAWGFRWLIQNFNTVSVEERKDIEFDLSREHKSKEIPTFITEEELDKYRYTHSYVKQRGVNDAVIDVFDIGYDKEKDAITFPVRDKQGNCLFIARRNVKYKRFDLPKGIDKPLYGLYETYKNIGLGADTSELYVCEGLFDCLKLWSNGKPAVAGFGCEFNKVQIQQLKELPIRKLILALDNDKAGREATEKLKKRLKNKIITVAVIPENRKDVGECTEEELANLQETW